MRIEQAAKTQKFQQLELVKKMGLGAPTTPAEVAYLNQAAGLAIRIAGDGYGAVDGPPFRDPVVVAIHPKSNDCAFLRLMLVGLKADASDTFQLPIGHPDWQNPWVALVERGALARAIARRWPGVARTLPFLPTVDPNVKRVTLVAWLPGESKEPFVDDFDIPSSSQA